MGKVIFESDSFISQGSLGIDPETGLERVVQYTNLNIDARKKILTITWNEVLISPNGQVVSIVNSGTFTRENLVGSMRYDALKNHPIGLGIATMLVALDFPTHPNYEQIIP
jgi:hypothetical protein